MADTPSPKSALFQATLGAAAFTVFRLRGRIAGTLGSHHRGSVTQLSQQWLNAAVVAQHLVAAGFGEALAGEFGNTHVIGPGIVGKGRVHGAATTRKQTTGE